ncbi:hypothetical protein [Halovulum dunhuangense]|nr:hypothetical protein [Halovulum dunhuangense]
MTDQVTQQQFNQTPWAALPDGRLREALRAPETDPKNNKEGK